MQLDNTHGNWIEQLSNRVCLFHTRMESFQLYLVIDIMVVNFVTPVASSAYIKQLALRIFISTNSNSQWKATKKKKRVKVVLSLSHQTGKIHLASLFAKYYHRARWPLSTHARSSLTDYLDTFQEGWKCFQEGWKRIQQGWKSFFHARSL